MSRSSPPTAAARPSTCRPPGSSAARTTGRGGHLLRGLLTATAAAALTVVAAAADPPTAAPATEPPQAADLVQRLGAETFAEREAAAAEIFAAGTALLPALREAAASDPDPEIRLRAGLVYRQIASTDFETRAAAFIADGTDAHTFPGWRYTAAQMGSSPAVRTLFIKISREHPAFAAALDGTPRDRSAQALPLIESVQQAHAQLREPDISDTFALLLVAADPNIELTPGLETALVSMLVKSGASQVWRDAHLAEPFGDLVGRWLRRARMDHADTALYLALQWDLEPALALALRTLVETRDPDRLRLAMQTIARFGDRQHADQLRPLLDDARPADDAVLIDGDNSRRPVQIGDVAMATIALLHDVPLETIGFSSDALHPKMAFDPSELRLGPAADARRRARATVESWLDDPAAAPSP